MISMLQEADHQSLQRDSLGGAKTLNCLLYHYLYHVDSHVTLYYTADKWIIGSKRRILSERVAVTPHVFMPQSPGCHHAAG